MAEFKITINGITKSYPEGTTFETIVKDNTSPSDIPVATVIFNGKIKELFKRPDCDGTLTLNDLSTPIGGRAYKRTATYLFVKACSDVVGLENLEKLKFEFAVGTGYFFSIKSNRKVDGKFAADIKQRMLELVNADIRIMKSSMPLDKAKDIFAKQKMVDKEKLCKYRHGSVINVYELDGYYDYYYGHMLPATGYVKYFDVLEYNGGFILNLPTRKNPMQVEPYKPLDKLYATMMESTEWGDMQGIDTVGDLNDVICGGDMKQLVLVQEALQERKIGEIAKDIASRENVKFVMIAGPSSSGKTSFSYRLSVQLQTLGLKPHPIAVDDYFVNREDTPLDENGNLNFECLEAIDIKQFNEDMNKLLKGERVELPTFNFKIGRREYKGNYKQLGPDDVLVIEGIHALNDKMSSTLPIDSKYKIYISALTTLNVDEHNRIPTTDARLLRRMVRDFRTRGASATRTIGMWPSVRRGEEENIFPYQESADAMFNSVQLYEIAALKTFAEPILHSVKPEDPEYPEAKRLLKFLEYFLCMDTSFLPNNSIVREFVGGSCFNV